MLDAYIGIPWAEHACGLEGSNCWGLLRLIYRDLRGIALPGYDEDYASEGEQCALSALIARSRETWDLLAPGAEQTFDGVLMRDGRFVSHIGMVVTPGRLIHVQRGDTSRIESYRVSPLKHRVVGFYRYRSEPA
jgi:cell wall-associated NlpC family hydrolase